VSENDLNKKVARIYDVDHDCLRFPDIPFSKHVCGISGVYGYSTSLEFIQSKTRNLF